MKVVEGQLEFWGMVSNQSKVSDSLASQNIREFISRQAEQQAFTPDVLPSEIKFRPDVESGNGSLVNHVG